MTREPPLNGDRRRRPVSKKSPIQTGEALQLTLLIDAERVTTLDPKSRFVVVNLLARLLREAVGKDARVAADDEA